MRTITSMAGLAALAMLASVHGPARAEDKVEVRVVKYAGLADTIEQHKGKVVVVDFWADS